MVGGINEFLSVFMKGQSKWKEEWVGGEKEGGKENWREGRRTGGREGKKEGGRIYRYR